MEKDDGRFGSLEIRVMKRDAWQINVWHDDLSRLRILASNHTGEPRRMARPHLIDGKEEIRCLQGLKL
jgi:hypothetical protein